MNLHLYEELLLLALRDQKGTITGTWYKQAIGAAVLAELLLEERLVLAQDGKRVGIQSSHPLGDALIDDCLDLVARHEKPLNLDRWLSKFANQPQLVARAAEDLVTKGVLSEQKSRILWVFESLRYPELNHEPERLLLERLERVIFGPPTEVDARTAIVISLAHRTGILGQVFDKKELKARKQHIEAIIAGERLGVVVEKVIQAISAAIMVSTVIVPVVIS